VVHVAVREQDRLARDRLLLRAPDVERELQVGQVGMRTGL
jgi:hypothetical protein